MLDQLDIIRDCALAGGILSLIGSSYIVISFFSYSSLRSNPIFQNLLYLVFGNILLGLMTLGPFIYTVSDSDPVCELAGVLVEFSKISSLFWMAIFAKNIQKIFMEKQGFKNQNQLLILFCVIIPVSTGFIPYFFGWYGSSGVVCWIRDSLPLWENIGVCLGMQFAPTVILFVYSVHEHLKTIKFLSQSMKPSWEFYQLLLYPGILFVVNVMWMIARTMQAFETTGWQIVLAITAFLIYGQGFFDALVYGFNYGVRRLLWDSFLQRCCSKDKESEPESLSTGLSIQRI